MTAGGVAVLEISVVTVVSRLRMRDISFQAAGMFSSGCATRSIDGFSDKCGPGLRDSMSAERVGVYEGMYRSEKYNSKRPSDRTGPMACRGREQKTDVGHHQMRDCSGIFNSWSLCITGRPTR